ncbi:hypothetical protein MAMC_00161 [Methylacidimicrobium cyclopophantes]|uniref:Cyclophilin TM1367-like domain-containing protein n=1 Tax=Methylacidimicrobium cyclopophantes TaxID=1041766 RepID=A0A5E6M5M4_9BACT|nr:cyclophilin-like fold protein [Methylacidimicrobium cyclopophantes]VVM04645.1 hypothetical protein MAMC_00161 [Methylacidimicrobium cyclopophantes]
MESEPSRIRISWKTGNLIGILRQTPTARKLLAALPFSSRVETWGEEVYFPTPIDSPLELEATDVVEPGTICYWVEGRSLALPYGPTPVSVRDECRLVTRVNLVGKLLGDPKTLASLRSGDPVRIERVGI